MNSKQYLHNTKVTNTIICSVRNAYGYKKQLIRKHTPDQEKSDAIRKNHILFIFFCRRNELSCKSIKLWILYYTKITCPESSQKK